MSDTVIRVENLGKKYIIGHQQQERYTALRDVITNKVKSIGNLLNPQAKNENPAFEEFWALKDVSFDIKQGDRVGIIGRNGAGKSTLLKILSRITEPTKGSIKIKGRVASLLEVGTGFHPELTGRENIFLNGAILGMGKEEIKRKFDEIVAFAEVEKFLDTPVKRYSSGMYVRLAFAVAAHLEPEILIVDEVLAVGDAQFQKKCLGKMEDVGKEGRTVLFVSHNMAAIQQLCKSGILLNQGSLLLSDTISDVVSKYSMISKSTSGVENCKSKFDIQILEFCIRSKDQQESVNTLIFNRDYILTIKLNAKHSITGVAILLRVYNHLGVLVSSICTLEEGIECFTLEGFMEINMFLPSLQLFPDEYNMSLFMFDSTNQAFLEAENIFNFDVLGSMVRKATMAYRKDHGIVRISDEISVSQK
jgi:lipopolysaccharide transport system ATP-binding protein